MKEIKNNFFDGIFYIDDDKILDSDKKELGKVSNIKALDNIDKIKSIWEVLELVGKDDQVRLIAPADKMVDYLNDAISDLNKEESLSVLRSKIYRIGDQYILIK